MHIPQPYKVLPWFSSKTTFFAFCEAVSSIIYIFWSHPTKTSAGSYSLFVLNKRANLRCFFMRHFLKFGGFLPLKKSKLRILIPGLFPTLHREKPWKRVCKSFWANPTLPLLWKGVAKCFLFKNTILNKSAEVENGKQFEKKKKINFRFHIWWLI